MQTPVERGKLLVTVGGCHDCHCPKRIGPNGPEVDPARMLSGHPEGMKIAAPYRPANGSPWIAATNDMQTAWSGPWGVSFAANLTPDTNTGLRSGVSTEGVFIKALKSGNTDSAFVMSKLMRFSLREVLMVLSDSRHF